MRAISYTTRLDWDAPGYYNPPTALKVRYQRQDHEFRIGPGSRDALSVYREGPVLLVLCVNEGFPYVGLETFDLETDQPSGEVFLQGDEQVSEALGKRGTDLSPCTIIARLAEYCHE